MIRINGGTIIFEVPHTTTVCGRTYRNERLFAAGETDHEGTLSSPVDAPRSGVPLSEVPQLSLFEAVTVRAITARVRPPFG